MFKAAIINSKNPEFRQCLEIRKNVFGDCAAYAPDEFDSISLHALVTQDGEPCATARLYPTDDGWLLGRVAVLEAFRNQGYGELVVRLLLFKAMEIYDEAKITVHSLPDKCAFYEKFGLRAAGDILVSGVKLIKMSADCNRIKLKCGDKL